MAVIQYTGIVNQIRGKLNGSVFNKSRNAYTLQSKQQPTRAVRGFQDMARNAFAEVQRSWAAVSGSSKTAWAVCAENNPTLDRFGDQTVLSGYNQFIKCNLMRLRMGLSILQNPQTTTAAPVSSFSNDGYSLSPRVDEAGRFRYGYELYYSADSYDPNYYISFEISTPLSRGVTQYYGTWRVLGSAPLSSSNVMDGTTYMSESYPRPVNGQLGAVRIRIVHILTGAVVHEETSSTDFYY